MYLNALASTPGLHYLSQPLPCPRWGSLHPSFQSSFSRSWIPGAEEQWAWGRRGFGSLFKKVLAGFMDG